METSANWHMFFPRSFPITAKEKYSGVNIYATPKRNIGFQELSAVPHCQCSYCRVWGVGVMPQIPSNQLQHGYYSGLPSAGILSAKVVCSCCSPALGRNDVKTLEETKQRPHCSICGKTFARASTLKIHLRIHSGEKPYQCTYCAKAFVQSANLVAHLRTHTGEKPYHCYICQKRFSQSSSIKTHIRTHTGERPFPCIQCGKCFSDRSTLSKHRRIHQKMKTELKNLMLPVMAQSV